MMDVIYFEMDTYLKRKYYHELKSRLREKFPQLTDADLFYSESIKMDLRRMASYKLRMKQQETKK
jgi:hypothetical protein